MTIIEQLSIGRVWQEEGERNGDAFRFLNGTDLSLQIPLRMTYTTRPTQDLRINREAIGKIMVDNIENIGDISSAKISTVTSKDELPNSIIVTQVPEEVFVNPGDKQNFSQLFTQIEENIHFDFLRSFRRVRVIFSTPEKATAAKLIVQGFSFNGHQLKAFFAQRVILRNSSLLLSPPPVEKQFLISPPCSPPVGWEQTRVRLICHVLSPHFILPFLKEMPPVVCSFDLMARLASFALDEKYEVHNGDESTPTIIIHPCETPIDAPSKIEMPKTPRPSSPVV
uniref:RRM domain-containing protein n=1 Tax=Heterorhabditis bacteriophora TaxID=37862 RepID=A0A1I7X6U0_HETBA